MPAAAPASAAEAMLRRAGNSGTQYSIDYSAACASSLRVARLARIVVPDVPHHVRWSAGELRQAVGIMRIALVHSADSAR